MQKSCQENNLSFSLLTQKLFCFNKNSITEICVHEPFCEQVMLIGSNQGGFSKSVFLPVIHKATPSNNANL